jgi:hypothetical protein
MRGDTRRGRATKPVEPRGPSPHVLAGDPGPCVSAYQRTGTDHARKANPTTIHQDGASDRQADIAESRHAGFGTVPGLSTAYAIPDRCAAMGTRKNLGNCFSSAGICSRSARFLASMRGDRRVVGAHSHGSTVRSRWTFQLRDMWRLQGYQAPAYTILENVGATSTGNCK